jgi:hypothetical protein
MAFCNPKAELSALLCNIPANWRDSIVTALTCILSLRRDGDSTCDGVKECETLTAFQPITVTGNTITFSYRDEKGVTYNRNIDITTVINNLLNGVDAACLMDQEDWEALTFVEKLDAIYAKACCVHGNCGDDTGGLGCGCEDCGDDDVPCIGLNACVCTEYIVTGTAPFTFSYKDCTTKLVTEYESLVDNMVGICAIRGSLVLPDGVFCEEIGECGATTTTTSSTSTTTTIESSSTTTTTTEATTTSSTSTTTTTTAAPTTTTTSTTTTTTSTTTTSTTTTSTSTTTTTTIAETLEFYIADEYSCDDCSLTNAGLLVTLPISHSVQVGKFYIPTIYLGFVYSIISSDPQPPASAIALTTANYTTCGGACADA